MNNPALYTQFLEIIKEINIFVWEKILSGQFKIENFHYSEIKFISAITLLFSSTFFIRAVIRGFDQIFNKPCYKNVIISYFVPILINLGSVLLIIIFVLFNFTISMLIKYADIVFLQEHANFLNFIKYLTSTPVLLIFFISLFFYKFFPGKKIPWKLAITISLFFAINIFIVKFFGHNMLKASDFSAYGSANVMLLTLIGLYLFFSIFLFWAQFAYVYDNLKILTIKFFIDSKKELWFKDFVKKTVIDFAKGHINFYEPNQSITINLDEKDKIFFLAEGKIKINDKYFSDEKNPFFIPNKAKGNILKFNVIDKTVLINMPTEMYYELVNSSNKIKQIMINLFKDKT
jgi:hypothetical protein